MSQAQLNAARIALLPDRGVVAVTGPDATNLLAGIITSDMALLDARRVGRPATRQQNEQPAIFAGLLSPQGKILFEFFVVKFADGFLLDVMRDQAGALVKRLAMYRLRAKAEIADRSDEMAVVAGLDGDLGGRAVAFADPRCPDLWPRAILLDAKAWSGTAGIGSNRGWSTAADYHAHRIALGIPEGAKDWDFGDAYPHEANFDLLNGVSFDKGCYVGQEIVARMQHKTVVRKRVVKVTGASELPAARPDIRAGEAIIGRLGSVAGNVGLALLRLDRVIEFQDKGIAITADGIPLHIDDGAIASYRRATAKPDGAA